MTSAITIGSTTVERDEHGRFNLNALHRVAGGEERHAPAFFMRKNRVAELIREIHYANPHTAPVWTINGGVGRGTYVVRELVYAYAMWISAAFHLKVIQAFDAMATGHHQIPEAPRTFAEALRLAADQAERLEQQQRLLEAQKPAVEAHARLMASDGTYCLRDAAKVLGIPERKLVARMEKDGVLFRQNGRLRAYSVHEAEGRFLHRAGASSANGHAFNQVRVSTKGLDWLGKRYAAALEGA
jgi:phage antirepressor YoqD-like protein